MKYPKYPAYKESGIEWFDPIPEHWKIIRLKYAGNINMGQSPDSSEYNLDGNGLPFLQGCAEFGLIHPSPTVYCERPKKIANSGEFLFSVRAPVGKTNTADQSYGIGRGLCAITPSQIHYRFFWWLLGIVKTQLDSVSTGSTYDSVTIGQVADTFLTLPSQSEQTAIADFLDTETAQIDALIAKQERLIALLQEKRQALISHAVTKGLNPDAPMKDSGVEWLGEVPAHWDVTRLKFLVSTPLMYGANESGDSDIPDHPRFIRITDVDNSGNLREDTFRSLPPDIAEQYLLNPGDVLLARSGATVGKTFIYKSEWGIACFAGYLIRARLDASSLMAEYFWYFCQSHPYWKYIAALQIQATIQNVSAGKYNDLPVSFPDLAEQKSVVAFLNHETTKIDTLIEKARAAIERLQERRTALISAAVTGKIDVRAAMN